MGCTISSCAEKGPYHTIDAMLACALARAGAPLRERHGGGGGGAHLVSWSVNTLPF